MSRIEIDYKDVIVKDMGVGLGGQQLQALVFS